jgi:hypothetical protein
LVPTIDGKAHHFNNVGLYDGLFVMQDTETKTLWDHITGEALYGPLVGHTLGPIGNLLEMNVKEALAMDPKMNIAISDRPYFGGGKRFGSARGFGPGSGGRSGPGSRTATGPSLAPDPNAQLTGFFVPTLGKEDQRRPRMDMGLGIWTQTTRRYYPVQRIRERGGAFIDRLDGRSVLIYVDPETDVPTAVFVEARSAEVQGTDIRLDNESVVRSGALFGRSGRREAAEHPQQVFTRWYGFALTFPGCEVFGE